MSFLVYERLIAGHRENYATTVAKLLDAETALGKSWGNFWRAFTARRLVITTLESAPQLYLAMVMLRGVIGRRSTVIATRSHVEPRDRWLWAIARRLGYSVLRRFPPIQFLTITPPDGADDPRMAFVEDIEFWDLPPAVFATPPRSALADRVREAKQDRKVILVSGTLQTSKGLEFLAAIFAHAPDLAAKFAVVCAGELIEPSRAALEPLRRQATIWEDRFLTRDEMLSLYFEADAVWCCYRPDYDVSSGIFGRAVQLGRPTIVRAGSLIERLQGRLGHGLALDYGNIAAAAARLAAADFLPSPAQSRYAQGSAALRSRIAAHHGGLEG